MTEVCHCTAPLNVYLGTDCRCARTAGAGKNMMTRLMWWCDREFLVICFRVFFLLLGCQFQLESPQPKLRKLVGLQFQKTVIDPHSHVESSDLVKVRSDVVHLQLNTKVRAKTLKILNSKFGHTLWIDKFFFFATADFWRSLLKHCFSFHNLFFFGVLCDCDG